MNILLVIFFLMKKKSVTMCLYNNTNEDFRRGSKCIG